MPPSCRARFSVRATPFADPGRRDAYRVDYSKMRDGGLDAAFFIVFVPQGERTPHATRVAGELALTKFAAIHRALEPHPGQIALARRAGDVARIARAQRLVAAIGVENGYVIGTDLARIAHYQELGARYLTRTHNGTNEICDSAIHIRGDRPEEWGGLSPFGREVVADLNRVGMMVDVSHTSRASMLQATALSRSPVVASHSNARALCDHPRNLDDEQLDAIRDVGGGVQCVALGGVVTAPAGPRDAVGVADFVNHIDDVAERIGIAHVGIASDFDGGGGIHGWNDASETFSVTLELVARGSRSRARCRGATSPAALPPHRPSSRSPPSRGGARRPAGCPPLLRCRPTCPRQPSPRDR